jgi:polar amino acid transport system substrate-binding protein
MKALVRLAGLLALALWIGSANAQTPSREVQNALAPSGTLRVGVYRGSPSSIIEGAAPQEAKGVGFDLGKSLAAALGVPFVPTIFPSNDRVLEAVKNGSVDVTFMNATAERTKDMDFSQTYMDVEKSFLVPDGSSLKSLADLDHPGLHVGVSKGSSTADELRGLYPGLALETVATLTIAREMLASHRLDAFATNKAILFQLSDNLPGSHVLDGRWGMEHFGAAIPKGREVGMPFLRHFIEAARADGSVAKAIQRAGLRGAVPDSGND